MFSFTHVGIVVSDTNISMQFYCKALGCIVDGCYADDTIRLTYLKAGTQTIELIQYVRQAAARTQAGPVDHLAFTVQNMEAAIARLKSAGAVFCFETPKLVNNRKIIFFTGPDGERLELIEHI